MSKLTISFPCGFKIECNQLLQYKIDEMYREINTTGCPLHGKQCPNQTLTKSQKLQRLFNQ